MGDMIRALGNKPIKPIGNAQHAKQSDIPNLKTRAIYKPSKGKRACFLVIDKNGDNHVQDNGGKHSPTAPSSLGKQPKQDNSINQEGYGENGIGISCAFLPNGEKCQCDPEAGK
jgi:hypothetical protein